MKNYDALQKSTKTQRLIGQANGLREVALRVSDHGTNSCKRQSCSWVSVLPDSVAPIASLIQPRQRSIVHPAHLFHDVFHSPPRMFWRSDCVVFCRLFDASVTMQETTMVYACGYLGYSMSAPFVGPIQTRLGFRGSAMAGVSLVVISMLACSQATTVAQLTAMYSLFGVGSGIA